MVSGGTALPTAWTLSAVGPTPISGHTGDPAITDAAVEAGTYALAESDGPSGLQRRPVAVHRRRHPGRGQPHPRRRRDRQLQHHQHVIPARRAGPPDPDQGGQRRDRPADRLDPVGVSGPTPISGHTGDPAITAAAVEAGTYALAESDGPPGYSAGPWQCTGGGTLVGANLTLAAGETVSCSITNTFIPPGPFLEHGAFVIGDVGADIDATVTWWSPQWAKKNPLTGGPAPASFKGFAATLDPSPPVVGGTWTTRPGASSHPPDTVPEFMAVIVTSSVTKDGSKVSGDIVRIVLVKTAPSSGRARSSRS